MTIGQRIAAARKAKGLTQRQLADAINSSDKAISRWERGESEPDLQSLVLLANYLEVSTDQLLTGSQEKTIPCEQSNRVDNSILLPILLPITGYMISLIFTSILEPGIRGPEIGGIDYHILGYIISLGCSGAALVILYLHRKKLEISRILHFGIYLITFLSANSATIFFLDIYGIILCGLLFAEVGFVVSTAAAWHCIIPQLIKKNKITVAEKIQKLRVTVTTVYVIIMAILIWNIMAFGFYDELIGFIILYCTVPITAAITIYYHKKKNNL